MDEVVTVKKKVEKVLYGKTILNFKSGLQMWSDK